MQYGVFSPILRTHSTKNKYINKEPWKFHGEYFDAIQKSVYLRYRLVPYIYTMSRKTYDTGIGICRPMYYDYSENSLSYSYKTEYMFGDNILIAPIGSPRKNGVSKVKVWLPDGNNWYEWNTGTLLKGGQELVRSFELDEYPVYIKAGAIIPMYQPGMRNLETEPRGLEIDIFPEGKGETAVYDDAGDDKSYATRYARTKITSDLRGQTQIIVISPTEGEYEGMPTKKDYYIKIYENGMPEEIIVNGRNIPYSAIEDGKSWSFCGSELSFVIPVKEVAKNKKTEIKIRYMKTPVGVDINNGLVKEMRMYSKKYNKTKDDGVLLNFVGNPVGKCEEINRAIEYNPRQFYQYIRYFTNNKDKGYEQMKNISENFKNKE